MYYIKFWFSRCRQKTFIIRYSYFEDRDKDFEIIYEAIENGNHFIKNGDTIINLDKVYKIQKGNK